MENDKKNNNRIKGVRVLRINAFLMGLGAVLTLFIFISTFRIKLMYKSVITSLTDYADCVKAIEEMKTASDFLTEQVRFFSINLAPDFMSSYFTEVNVYRRRENAIEIIQLTHNNDPVDVNLKLAKKESDLLMKREYLVMKLLSDGAGISGEQIPNEIKYFELDEKYKNLSGQEKIDVARSFLFNIEYIESKDVINHYILDAHNFLTGQYLSSREYGDRSMRIMFTNQILFVSMLFAVCVLLYFLLVTLVLRPLLKNLLAIENGTMMKLRGSYEINYLAVSYNSLCKKNEVRTCELRHKAEHDALTNLINREGFDNIKDELSDFEPVAYLIIDVDHFKSINDMYGHKVGDDVLKKIANLLMEHFRSTDYVARIGGDEFSVIMTKLGKSIKSTIQRKIDDLNGILMSGVDGLPCVSLSVGVVISESGYDESLMEKADKALYYVKNNGRCNCAFYLEGDKK